MFASVNGLGRLDLWNLNNDTEVFIFPPLSPIYMSLCLFHLAFASYVVDREKLGKPNTVDNRVFVSFTLFQVPTASSTIESSGSLSRCRWTHTGNHIAAGDDNGRVYFFDVGEVGLGSVTKTFCSIERF